MEEDYGAFIEDRRAEILQRVDASLAVSGRTRDEVELVAVSKTVGLMQVLAAIDAGYRVFGENRPQELHRKLEGLELVQETRPVRFDMIGNLQTKRSLRSRSSGPFRAACLMIRGRDAASVMAAASLRYYGVWSRASSVAARVRG